MSWGNKFLNKSRIGSIPIICTIFMNESEMLDEIFGNNSLWRGKYKIQWCDLCETYIIVCPECGHGSCSCGGCPECHSDVKEWWGIKPNPIQHLTIAERNAVEKYLRIKQLMKDCFKVGKTFDAKWLQTQELLREKDEEMFKDQL